MHKFKDENKQTTLCTLNMDKSVIVQETKIFDDTKVSPHKCIEILTKLIFVLEQGSVLSSEDATRVFFSITKLFQFRHPILRRLCHISIKLLSKMANDIIIATSCLMKDMISDDHFIRASAIRALCSITDASMLPGIERYIKQAIVDRSPAVSSAALVSSSRFVSVNPEFIKRWLNEISEICKNETYSQYHALGLFYLLKQNDFLTLSKLVSRFSKNFIKIIPSALLCIRISALCLSEWEGCSERASLLDFLECCVHNRNEIVSYEACRALISLKNLSQKQINSVISAMRMFLSSQKTVVRYSAVCTICHMSIHYPSSISECALDLESLLSDNNKSLATMAATTLLRVGSDSNIERIIKLISGFISEISENFRSIIVKELRHLAIKYPSKSQLFLNFIASMLREEGGIEYKHGLVEIVITIIHQCPSLLDSGLLLLCEFIEDCEHVDLLNNILYILSVEGPSSSNPSQFIRYIYNRIMLESCQVRASAIVCLAKFAFKTPDIKPSIMVIIERCFCDSDDEVRDRAIFYYSILRNNSFSVFDKIPKIEPIRWLKALDNYIKNNDASSHFSEDLVEEENIIQSVPADLPKQKLPIQPVKSVPVEFTQSDKLLADLDIVSSERYSHTSKLQRLTDADAEFNVICFKHFLYKCVVIEYIIKNTLEDQFMSKVSIKISTPPEFKVIKSTSVDKINPNASRRCFVVISMPLDPTYISDSFPTSLTFYLSEFDSEFSDEPMETYATDNTEIYVSEHFKTFLVSDFEDRWMALSDDYETETSCALDNYSNVIDASEVVISMLGLSACSQNKEVNENDQAATINLSGIYRTGKEVLCKLHLRKDGRNTVLLKVQLKCEDPNVSENIFSIVS